MKQKITNIHYCKVSVVFFLIFQPTQTTFFSFSFDANFFSFCQINFSYHLSLVCFWDLTSTVWGIYFLYYTYLRRFLQTTVFLPHRIASCLCCSFFVTALICDPWLCVFVIFLDIFLHIPLLLLSVGCAVFLVWLKNLHSRYLNRLSLETNLFNCQVTTVKHFFM